MQTRFQYAEYWQVCILHILNIYAPPTLLMTVRVRVPQAERPVLTLARGPSELGHLTDITAGAAGMPASEAENTDTWTAG